MKVLVVGGSGLVGSMVLPALTGRHRVTVADRVPPGRRDVSYVPLDARDPVAAAEACSGQDGLVWLAMGPKEGWSEPNWAVAQFDVNVTGLAVMLRAAGEAGIARAVLASTGSVFADYRRTPPSARPDATDAYGVSKACGELVARAAASTYPMTIVALRLIHPLPDDQWQADRGPDRDVLTAGSDVGRAFGLALEADLPSGLHTPWVSGDHRGREVDVSGTRTLLGWEPLARRRGRSGPEAAPA